MRKSRLKKSVQSKLIEHFVAGTTARCAASLVGINHKSATYYFMRLREIIAQQLACETAHIFEGEVEVDESYFGGSRKGKRGRGAGGKVPVFVLLKRGGKVYTQIIPDAKQDTLVPIIQKKVLRPWIGKNIFGADRVCILGNWETGLPPTMVFISLSKR